MKYIIMCGGKYVRWGKPRQLTIFKGETIVERTIRLLRENGIQDIAISSNLPDFDEIGVPILRHDNPWKVFSYNNSEGTWADGFYPTDYPVCYLFGDVIFSDNAIRTIINTDTNDVEFFASSPPFAKEYVKPHAEPFGFKVINLKHFWQSIDKFKQYKKEEKFYRDPMAWELWQLIKDTPINRIDYTNYTVINDYTCDIDNAEDVEKFRWLNI